MNNYYIKITKHLNLKLNTAFNTMNIEQITSEFTNHVSIKNIHEVFPKVSSNNSEFTKVTEKITLNTTFSNEHVREIERCTR